jgi:hypothetical protein
VASTTVPTFAAVVSASCAPTTATVTASHAPPTSSGIVTGSAGAATASVSGLFASGLLTAIVEAQTAAATAEIVGRAPTITDAIHAVSLHSRSTVSHCSRRGFVSDSERLTATHYGQRNTVSYHKRNLTV